ncbi:hypothetical protein COW36_14710 [bacterium (Candidatus Blackallbacteria) CG17_big_fil_post_rev_8_21_14_2_50_48_46]|uniref:HlyC/CorC family transporter n=1 Tax=bacterium (Candidatus Blackallbacteria) CG17_big_fil_post_rev_8_21_14_2_50_48_46 TaxID=2014261 RepID=A0A2M7G2E3_9BACT|nr:MAG: hypothetical protein COW64_11840 [bacterium (Candidatus Blackallbacteria) CG18_big_fil_WC_8_21_14_2_50_49_26]PIW15966.1 MAG: hypothetical protein COW36_14710 [bacterium (Candidatus Blackallbacteria) CG17_big_fil_post_rev_8_21_14_2_50_48_46]PIW50378.1 MAG: hypothetical protein COW20_02425 [bacterium (Candidatus Blackallbacteria) CG13_big_fil_rev_8_21_14_2_50_49_14]
MKLWTEILLVLLLILINGFFSMSELAVLSARRSILQKSADKGSLAAKTALHFIQDSRPFLASIQIGITAIGILAGVFSGATLTQELEKQLNQISLLSHYSQPLAMFLIVLAITYFSLVLGELVPKQLGLRHAEKISKFVALPVKILAWGFSPLVQFLNFSTDRVLKLFRQTGPIPSKISEEEIVLMLEEGKHFGIFSSEAHHLVERALDLGHASLAELMTPRREMISLRLDLPPSELKKKVFESLHSAYPVFESQGENVLGIVLFKQILPLLLSDKAWELQHYLQKPLFLHAHLDTYQTLEKFRHHQAHTALVFDDYGEVQGIVSLSDILQAWVHHAGERHFPLIERLQEGFFQVQATISLDAFGEYFGLEKELQALPSSIHSLAGLVLYLSGKIPEKGEIFTWKGLEFLILEMKGPRLDLIRIQDLRLHAHRAK